MTPRPQQKPLYNPVLCSATFALEVRRNRHGAVSLWCREHPARVRRLDERDLKS